MYEVGDPLNIWRAREFEPNPRVRDSAQILGDGARMVAWEVYAGGLGIGVSLESCVPVRPPDSLINAQS